MTSSVALTAMASLLAALAVVELAGARPGTGPSAARRPRRTARPRDAEAAARGPRWSRRSVGDARTEALLDAAGRVTVPDEDALATQRRLAAAVAASWACALGLLIAPAGIAIGAGFAGAALGRLVPGALLARAGRARVGALRDEAPELLDLFAVALGCGLPVGAALAAVGEWGTGPLAAGVAGAARELEHGAGVDPTLARLVREHPAGELDAAVAVLQRSRRHGTPAAAPLRALAGAARQDRARRAMDHAARAAPRVQLVAALLLVPAALCVLASAMVAGGIG